MGDFAKVFNKIRARLLKEIDVSIKNTKVAKVALHSNEVIEVCISNLPIGFIQIYFYFLGKDS